FRYLNLYNTIKQLKSEGCNITGFTFWGNIDKYSWLQSKSNVGGGMTSTSRQFPLLFDDDYNVKPAYWAFVDATKIKVKAEEPVVEESTAEESSQAPVEESTAEESKESSVVEESMAGTDTDSDDTVNAVPEENNSSMMVFVGAFGIALAVLVVALVVVLVIKKKKTK
ncbi:MAG: endo-1,4-beta-xylanase, partial [Lachnospiraceae bacterium]|nr:endo-1,4-beta-xylanase [Lachnospiraceae bacterium]